MTVLFIYSSSFSTSILYINTYTYTMANYIIQYYLYIQVKTVEESKKEEENNNIKAIKSLEITIRSHEQAQY